MPAERVIPLPVDEPHIIDGVTVTLMDANHCPGACMMLFKVPVKGSKPQVTCLTILHVSASVILHDVPLSHVDATVASVHSWHWPEALAMLFKVPIKGSKLEGI